MSEKKLTDSQIRRIEELKEEFIEKIKNMPEKKEPHKVLDGGGGRFHDLGAEFQRRLQEIMDEEGKDK